ncbi:hypothetical protein CCACVL1_10395 [Corchorus capsularis]|uniref:Uncharacterized protein n=1 Tax=Corchorus capsularis TaxID=210143 RepID=A0A1R3IRA4_COCAP|nr:hypothetical protein CCACVL1_10395 [Corchorus capsularis]
MAVPSGEIKMNWVVDTTRRRHEQIRQTQMALQEN